MTINETNNFYNEDEKKYILKHNNEFLNLYMDLFNKNYRPYISIKDLQELINKLVIWYEIKYPEKELDEMDGIHNTNFNNIKKLSKVMTFEELLYRLTNKEYSFINCSYRSSAGGFYYNERLKKNIPNLLLIINEKGDLGYSLYSCLFIDVLTGKSTTYLNKYLVEKNIKIEDIYNKLKENNSLDLTNIKTCLLNHEGDIVLRDMILELVALNLLYSKNTIPEHGYIRAKRFIKEFNKKLNTNLSTEEIDYLINKEYNTSLAKNNNEISKNNLNILIKKQKKMIKSLKKIKQ